MSAETVEREPVEMEMDGYWVIDLRPGLASAYCANLECVDRLDPGKTGISRGGPQSDRVGALPFARRCGCCGTVHLVYPTGLERKGEEIVFVRGRPMVRIPSVFQWLRLASGFSRRDTIAEAFDVTEETVEGWDWGEGQQVKGLAGRTLNMTPEQAGAVAIMFDLSTRDELDLLRWVGMRGSAAAITAAVMLVVLPDDDDEAMALIEAVNELQGGAG
jgi:hypothetical protein